jgi:hypothetical protein
MVSIMDVLAGGKVLSSVGTRLRGLGAVLLVGLAVLALPALSLGAHGDPPMCETTSLGAER